MRSSHCWQDIENVFDGIDFVNTEDVLEFSQRIRLLCDSVDWKKMIALIDQRICPEKRKYSKGFRTVVPYGYYAPSEAFILMTKNVNRGRLLKNLDNPDWIYDYDDSGKIVRISQMHSYKHMHGKASSLTYCLYSGLNVLMFTWDPDYHEGSPSMIFPGLSSITFHVKEANGNTLYICNSSVKLLQAPIMTEVEVYGPVVYGEQTMERYTTIANLEAHVSAIIVHHCRIHYSEEGRMQKCECYGAEKIADYPQNLLREMFLF